MMTIENFNYYSLRLIHTSGFHTTTFLLHAFDFFIHEEGKNIKNFKMCIATTGTKFIGRRKQRRLFS